MSAVGASFSIAQQLNVIYRRLRGFQTFAGSPEAYDEVRDLCRELGAEVLRLGMLRIIGAPGNVTAMRGFEHPRDLVEVDEGRAQVIVQSEMGPTCGPSGANAVGRSRR